MFENILRQRNTLKAFNDMLVSKGKSVEITDYEWDRLNDLTNFLVVFKDATTILSGVYYPTSPLVLNQVYIMTEKLQELETSQFPMFRKMVRVIKKKFQKYFANVPLVFTCSAALNPCLNVGGVQHLIKVILENLDLHLTDDLNYVSNEVKRFENHFTKLFEIYATKYGYQHNPIINQTGGSSQASSSRGDMTMNLYNVLLNDATKRQRTSAPTSELGQYMSTNFLTTLSPEDFRNFDILNWWKDREAQFPILSAMARDLLAVQASTVASESAFSTSGRIISERRSRLTPDSVEVCVCLKDYLDGVDRIQNVSMLEGPLLENVEEIIEDEEMALGISPTTTELDEGEFEPIEVQSVDEDEVWDDLE